MYCFISIPTNQGLIAPGAFEGCHEWRLSWLQYPLKLLLLYKDRSFPSMPPTIISVTLWDSHAKWPAIIRKRCIFFFLTFGPFLLRKQPPSCCSILFTHLLHRLVCALGCLLMRAWQLSVISFLHVILIIVWLPKYALKWFMICGV